MRSDLSVAHEAVASPYGEMSWEGYEALVARVLGRFVGHYRREAFEYLHPALLQPRTPERFRKAYAVKVTYLAWGDPAKPLMICFGGVANVARRFDHLAMELKDDFHVVCPDWVGRGESGRMRDQGDYGHATYVEQTRQLLRHLGQDRAVVLGSSMGASVALDLAAEDAGRLVSALILNDTGPYLAAARRRSRAETLARHYVFRTAAEMFRKIGASQKFDGPMSDDARLNGSYHQTRWSDEDGGRVYRHDVRALQEYRLGARKCVRQWEQWDALACPVLAIRGMESDVLMPQTLRRMQRKASVTVMHVPFTGHTPTLSDPNHIECIREWLSGGTQLGREFSSPYCGPSHGQDRRAGARPMI